MNHKTLSFAQWAVMPLLAAGLSTAMFATEASDTTLPLWELGIGAAAYHQANYPGSDLRSTSVLPFPYLIYRGEWFRIDRNLQGILYETQRIKVDFSASATSPVKSDDSDARIGMPDLDRTFEVGPAVNLLLSDLNQPYSLWGQLAVRKAYSVDTDDWDFSPQGLVVDGSLRYQRPLKGQRLRLSAEIGASFADDDYTGYFYDVPAAFATPQRAAYNAGSGYAGSHVGVGLSGVSGQWRWSLKGTYLNMEGSAFQDSPLLDSKHDFTVGASLAWMFWQSERRVTPKNTSPAGEFNEPLLGF